MYDKKCTGFTFTYLYIILPCFLITYFLTRITNIDPSALFSFSNTKNYFIIIPIVIIRLQDTF